MKAVRRALVGTAILTLGTVGLWTLFYGGGFLFLSLTEPVTVGGTVDNATVLMRAAFLHLLGTAACAGTGWKLARKAWV